MKYKNVTEIFNSVNDLYAALQRRSVNETFAGKDNSLTKGREAFYGTSDMETANELLLNGDAENSAKLQTVRVKTNADKYSEKFKKQTERGVVGFLPCIPAYLSGQPRNMFSIKRVYQKTKIINLIIDQDIPGNVSADKIINAGAQIASAVCSLEKAGVRINLFVGMSTKKENQTLTLLVKIKNSGAPLNKLRITYPIVHPSFTRRHFFRWMETNENKIRSEFVKSYGNVANVDPKIIPDSRIVKTMDIIRGNKNCDDIVRKILS